MSKKFFMADEDDSEEDDIDRQIVEINHEPYDAIFGPADTVAAIEGVEDAFAAIGKINEIKQIVMAQEEVSPAMLKMSMIAIENIRKNIKVLPEQTISVEAYNTPKQGFVASAKEIISKIIAAIIRTVTSILRTIINIVTDVRTARRLARTEATCKRLAEYVGSKNDGEGVFKKTRLDDIFSLRFSHLGRVVDEAQLFANIKEVCEQDELLVANMKNLEKIFSEIADLVASYKTQVAARLAVSDACEKITEQAEKIYEKYYQDSFRIFKKGTKTMFEFHNLDTDVDSLEDNLAYSGVFAQGKCLICAKRVKVSGYVTLFPAYITGTGKDTVLYSIRPKSLTTLSELVLNGFKDFSKNTYEIRNNFKLTSRIIQSTTRSMTELGNLAIEANEEEAGEALLGLSKVSLMYGLFVAHMLMLTRGAISRTFVLYTDYLNENIKLG